MLLDHYRACTGDVLFVSNFQLTIYYAPAAAWPDTFTLIPPVMVLKVLQSLGQIWNAIIHEHVYLKHRYIYHISLYK